LTPNARTRETESNVDGESKALISDGLAAENLGFEMRARGERLENIEGNRDTQCRPVVPQPELRLQSNRSTLTPGNSSERPDGLSKALISDGLAAENLGFEMRARENSKPVTGTEASAKESLSAVCRRLFSVDASDSEKEQANGESKALISGGRAAENVGFEMIARENSTPLTGAETSAKGSTSLDAASPVLATTSGTEMKQVEMGFKALISDARAAENAANEMTAGRLDLVTATNADEVKMRQGRPVAEQPEIRLRSNRSTSAYRGRKMSIQSLAVRKMLKIK
jgi:hypothetical protein